MKLHTGGGGKEFNDRVLAAEVRSLVLEEIKKGLVQTEDLEWKKAIVLRMSGSVLPRLNEHSGPDGEPFPLFSYVRSNDSDKQNKEPEEKN